MTGLRHSQLNLAAGLLCDLRKAYTLSEPLRENIISSHPKMGSNREQLPRPELLDQERGHPAVTQPPGQKFRVSLMSPWET